METAKKNNQSKKMDQKFYDESNKNISKSGEPSNCNKNVNSFKEFSDENKNSGYSEAISDENKNLKHGEATSDGNQEDHHFQDLSRGINKNDGGCFKDKEFATEENDLANARPYKQRKDQGRFQGNRNGGRGDRYRQRGNRNEKAKEEVQNNPSPREVGMKNPVMMLNEMYPPPSAPQYKVTSQTGPPNNPTFSMVCCLMGKSFSGTGKSKKEAKLACSQEALEQMFGQQFHTMGKVALGENPSNPRCLSEIDDWLELEGKNPVSILNELYPGITFSVVSSKGPSHAPQFCVRAALAEASFEGYGKSKKDAKLHASKALLVHLHKVGFDPMTGDLVQGQAGVAGTKAHSEYADGHSWADRVGRLVVAKFDELFGNSTYSKKKVMAGIVVAIDGKSSVICVSSGTKCINGEQLSLSGTVLNDCHAEIVARRCLLYWLYDQLEKAASTEDYSILVPAPEGGYAVRPGVTFHLFISTSPCGDARIFSLHEDPLAGTNILTGPRVGRNGDGSRGKLRSKIESGMGTVPLPEGVCLQQTWDGVMSGERLLTMACSDKILRWNVVGVQGSLLTHWLRPVYLSSITVGSRYHPGHMSRALHDRSRACGDLPEGFMITRPELLATTSPESRQASKAQEYSVNWIEGLIPEVVNGATGKTVGDATSRVSKRTIFDKFIKLASIRGHIPRPSLMEVLISKSGMELVPKTSMADISDISGNPEIIAGRKSEPGTNPSSRNAPAIGTKIAASIDGFHNRPPPPFQQTGVNQSLENIPVIKMEQLTGQVTGKPVAITQRYSSGTVLRSPITIAQRPPFPIAQRPPIRIAQRPPITITQRPLGQQPRDPAQRPMMYPRSGVVPNLRPQLSGQGPLRRLSQANQRQLGDVVQNLRYDQLKGFATGFAAAKERLVAGLAKSGAGVWVKKPIEQDQFSI